MRLVAVAKTDIGQTHTLNEDYVLANEQTGVYIVADGLGGQEAGEVASQLAAKTIDQFFQSHPKDSLNTSTDFLAQMTTALEQANEKVWTQAQNSGQKIGMGATIVVAWVNLPQVYIAHAGDARAYHFQQEHLQRLTRDHSLAEQQESFGPLDDISKKFQLGRVVTKALGQAAPLAPTVTSLTVKPGDWLVLCSDGFWNMVGESSLATALKQPQATLEHVAQQLVDQANQAGGKDNISLILLNFLET